MFARIAGRFAQAASRRYLLGLLSRCERKNGWTIAELAGDGTPDGMQRVLNFYSWSADEVRGDLRESFAAELGDPGGVLALAFLQVTAAQRGHQRLWTTFPDTSAA